MVRPALEVQRGLGGGQPRQRGGLSSDERWNSFGARRGGYQPPPQSHPLLKSTFPATTTPPSLLLVPCFHLHPLPSISASNSCPIFVQLFLSLSVAHSLLLLLLPVTLSFSISSISIHLLLLSLCSFSLGCFGKNGY